MHPPSQAPAGVTEVRDSQDSMEDMDMEDECTQLATQPVLDPRRTGGNVHGLDDDKLADTFCFLQPMNSRAEAVVQYTANWRPQHVLFQTTVEGNEISYYNPGEESSFAGYPEDGEPASFANPDADHGRSIALKFSSVSSLLNPHMGFVFGRGKGKADIMIEDNASVKRISNAHFRIYVKQNGVIMLEDTSTNGTSVDDHILKKNTPDDSRSGLERMLVNGTIVIVVCGSNEEIRFLVKIPQIPDSCLEQYDKNLRNYLFIQDSDRKEVRGLGSLHTAIRSTHRFSVATATHMKHLKDYNVIEEVGRGAFATVYKIASKGTGEIYAAKEIKKTSLIKQGRNERVETEVQIISALSHPHIIQYVSWCESPEYIWIVLEYLEHGDLGQYLVKNGPLPEPMVKTVAQQIFRALDYMHKMKVTHRDIKPDNIMISSYNPFTVKLSDFGLSKLVDDKTFMDTFCGTLLYCAPEVYADQVERALRVKRRTPKVRRHRYDQKADLWSFGAVLFMLLSHTPPFEGMSSAHAMRAKITSEVLDVQPLRENGVSKEGISLIRRLLNVDRELRPSEKACLRDVWLHDPAVPYEDDSQDMEESVPSEEDDDLDNLGEYAEDAEDELPSSPLPDGSTIANCNGLLSKQIDDGVLRQDFALRRVTHAPSETPSEIWPSDFVAQDDMVQFPPRKPRLFGEINQSAAARSSGVFGASEVGSIDPEASTGLGPHVQISRRPLLTKDMFAPSLQGAESEIGRLNMGESPSSGNSPVMTPNSPGTPTSPRSRQPTPTSLGPRPREEGLADLAEPAPKRPKFDRHIRIQPPANASQVAESGLLVPDQNSIASKEDTLSSAANESSHSLENDSNFQSAKADQSVTATSSQTQHGGEASTTSATLDNKTSQVGATSQRPAAAQEPSFARPHPVWGKLVAKAGSDPAVSHTLTGVEFVYGRSADCTHVVDPQDIRFSKKHFIIQLSKTTEAINAKKFMDSGRNWLDDPDLFPMIKIFGRNGMFINDRHVKQWGFARIYNGDEITVHFEPDYPKVKRPGKYLTFVCHFFHGLGKETREGYPDFANGEMNDFWEQGREYES